MMKKLVGSTLIEVLISLSILGISFVIGSQVILSLNNIYSPSQRFKTEVLIRNLIEEEISGSFLFEEERMIGGRRMVRKVAWQNQGKGLVEVEVIAYYADQEIGKRKVLKLIPIK